MGYVVGVKFSPPSFGRTIILCQPFIFKLCGSFLKKNTDFWVGQRPAGSDQSRRITDLKLKHWDGRCHFFSVLYSPLILRHNAVHSEVAE